MPTEFWLALTAVATLALALATGWLGWQTRNVAVKTGKLATTSDEEMQLLREQTTAIKEQAATGGEQLKELRESRFVEVLPMLRWQQPSAMFQAGPEWWRLGVTVVLTNEGPGPARIRQVDVSTDTREDFYPSFWVKATGAQPSVPFTMVPSDPVVFSATKDKSEIRERRARAITIKIRYGDLLGEFEYETVVRIEGTYEEDRYTARFLDSDDERSALERRLPKR
jgi:hypothetical protein